MFKKLFLLLALTLCSSISFSDETITVKNIKVSVNDKNASSAKNSAIEKAQIRGFQELVKRYYKDSSSKASSLSYKQIVKTVDSFELSGEKRSTIQYFAKITVVYNKSQIEKLLGSSANISNASLEEKELTANSNKNTELSEAPSTHNEPKSSMPAMDTLIVPVYENESKVYWFDKNNIWLSFWEKKLTNSSNHKFTIPAADLEDMTLLNKSIFSKNIIDLSPLFEKYGINNIAIAKLKKFEFEDKDHYQVDISYINRFSSSWQNSTLPEEGLSSQNSIMENYFLKINNYEFRVAENFVESMNTSAPQTIEVTFPLKNISDWLSIKEVFKNIKYITEVNLKSFSSDLYKFNLTYVIPTKELEKVLKNYNFILTYDNKSYLLVRSTEHDFEQ